MSFSKSKYGFCSIFIGLIALFIAIFSFLDDPFMPLQTQEPSLEEKFLSLKETAIEKFTGETAPSKKITLDQVINIAIPALSILAIAFAALSFINEEPKRVYTSGGAIALSATLFHIVAAYALFILFIFVAITVLVNFVFE